MWFARAALWLLLPLSGCARVADSSAAVTITVNGGRSDGVSGDETVAMCARFRLTPVQVAAYFRDARPVDSRAYNHDLEMSRCFAAGTVRLANGGRGSWTIDRERRGEVVGPDGSRQYLYCAACPTPPFEEVYVPD